MIWNEKQTDRQTDRQDSDIKVERDRQKCLLNEYINAYLVLGASRAPEYL